MILKIYIFFLEAKSDAIFLIFLIFLIFILIKHMIDKPTLKFPTSTSKFFFTFHQTILNK